MNFTNVTLGELLSSPNETIKRNAFSILKQLQRERDAGTDPLCTHVVTVAEYENKKLKGYRCTQCMSLVPVNPQYQKRKKPFKCYTEHTKGKYGGCTTPHVHE